MPVKKEDPNNLPLLEIVDNRGVTVTVDREANVIRGVKLLGLTSRNGREYLPEAVRAAAHMYEGKQVNVDHLEGNGRRSYRDRLGRLTGIEVRKDGLYGDLVLNPKHDVAEQLMWDAEHAPENVGFSHDAKGKTSTRGGKVIVEEIRSVRSVDLVAEPATTSGLFESEDSSEDTITHKVKKMSIELTEATIGQLKKDRPDLVESIVAELGEGEKIKAMVAENKSLKEELAAEKLDVAKQKVAASVAKEFAEAKLDPSNKTHVPELFTEQLLAESDDEKRKALIADRAKLIEAASRSGKPISSGRGTGEELKEMDLKDRVGSWRR
jgi:hypothetical protein